MFDLKEGFCSSSWGTAKRFCCSPHHRASDPDEDCGDWVEWAQLFNPERKQTWYLGISEFIPYAVVAVS